MTLTLSYIVSGRGVFRNASRVPYVAMVESFAMNPKMFLAFASGVFLTGGAAYFLSQPPGAKVDASSVLKAEEPKAPVADEPPVTPDRIISTAAPVVSKRSPVTRTAEKPAPVVAIAAVNPVVSAQPEPQPLKFDNPPPPPTSEPVARAVVAPPPPPAPKPNVVTIEAGTSLHIRLQGPLSSERNKVGDTFHATLDQPVVIDGFVIAERGARAEGRVTELERSGKVKGLARLVLELTRITTSDGQNLQVQTAAFERKAESTRKSDAAKIGIGAAIGAAIGGIAGGGKGAATGAGVGGATGAGGVLLSRGQAAELASETKLTFRLQEAVTVTERLNN